jgi:hypothetical protein
MAIGWVGIGVDVLAYSEVEFERSASLDHTCAEISEKYQVQALSRAFEVFKEFAICDRIVLCIGHFNEAAAGYEKGLIDSRWCASNARFLRRSRRAAKSAWHWASRGAMTIMICVKRQ